VHVAPVNLLHGSSKSSVAALADKFVPKDIKDQAIDMEFVWVSETGPGGQNALTSGLSVIPTAMSVVTLRWYISTSF
jgi:hypothetical protein